MSYVVKHNKEKYLIMESGDKRSLGKSIQYFLRKSIMTIIGILALIFLLAACWGSSLTNYIPLKNVFNFTLLSVGISTAMTFVFTVTKFIDPCPFPYRILNFFIIIISSYLAVTTISMKSIANSESRVLQDKEADKLYLRYEQLNNQYTRAQALYDSCMAVKWDKGAKGWRLQAEELKPQVDYFAFSNWQNRNNEMKSKGSLINEASISGFAFLSIPAKDMSMAQKLLLSIINDMIIMFCAFVVRNIFPKYFTIRIAGKKNNFWTALIGRSVVFSNGSGFISRCFLLFGRGNLTRKISSAQMKKNISAILKYRIDHPKLPYRQIAENVASQLDRPKPFSKGFISDVINHKYDHLLV